MAKNILILSASLRAGSNSEALANAFADGARAAGHTVEVISLRGKNIAFCRGCLACQTLGRCVIDDDAVAITEKMQHADVIAFARLQGDNKEPLLIPGAVHTDLYDRMDIIPFDRIEAFYHQYLK